MAADFKLAVTEAAEGASRNVAELLLKPESLDKLDLIRRTYEGKRQRVESRLKSVVQTQLDGVQQGLRDLKSTTKEIQEIKQDISLVEEYYRSCQDLGEKIAPIREVFRTHQELSTTYAHLEKIYDVPEAVKRTNDLITVDPDRQNLLVAHHELCELEHIRDELLIQLFHSKEAYVDKNTSLHRYFEDLIGLKVTLGSRLWAILSDTVNLVQVEPRRIVTAMKIVEREERLDTKLRERLEKEHIPLQHIPGRPVGWRGKVVEVLELSVQKRFERFRKPDTSETGWMRDHLQDLYRCFLQDLVAIKEYGQVCFPEEYQILQFYVTQYHQNLGEVVEELIQMDLAAGNILMLMSWAKALQEQTEKEVGKNLDDYGAIVPPHLAKGLESDALHHIHENVLQLSTKLIEFETKDWNKEEPPEADSDGHLISPLPRDLFEMIQQNVEVMSAIGPESKEKAIQVCWECLKELQKKYSDAVAEYASEFFSVGLRALEEGRGVEPSYKFFMPNMIACANNCLLCVDYLQDQREYVLQVTNQLQLEAHFQALHDELVKGFHVLGERCLGFLVHMEFENLNLVLRHLCTKDKWLGSEALVSTIVKTVHEYDEDFKLLKKDFHDAAVLESHHRMVVVYAQAMMERRMKLQNTKQRVQAQEQVVQEARLLSSTFQDLCTFTPRKKGVMLQSLAGVWGVKAEDVLPELMRVRSSFPDVRPDHVYGLLATRGDISKKKAQEMCTAASISEEAALASPPKLKHDDKFMISKRSPLLDVVVKNALHLL